MTVMSWGMAAPPERLLQPASMHPGGIQFCVEQALLDSQQQRHMTRVTPKQRMSNLASALTCRHRARRTAAVASQLLTCVIRCCSL